ncbi:MAG: hypothetical protein RSA48_03420 [Bacilli bacterium]
MALNQEDTYNLLKEINEYAIEIYYLIEKANLGITKRKSISFSELETLIYKENMEQVGLVFPRLIGKISLDDMDEAFSLYAKTFTKQDCIALVLAKTKDTHQHLREIKDIALTDELANQLIDDSVYKEALNLKYTKLMLNTLKDNPKDEFLSTKETFNKYDQAIKKLETENYKKLNSNINNYYISTITSRG